MKLLDGFLRQIEGTLTVEGPPGTRFVVRFPVRAQVQEPELRGVGGRPELVG